MKATTRSILVPALLIATLAVSNAAGSGSTHQSDGQRPQPPAATPLAVPKAPALALHDATPELANRLEWALGRFAAAELPLPPLDITFHTGGDGCNGHTGYFRSVSGVAVIDVCMPTKHIILHELAHAWAFQAVSAESQAEFLDYWGLTAWNAPDVDWGELAGEKAADTIAFALGDLPADPRDSLRQYLDGYELLTGTEFPSSN